MWSLPTHKLNSCRTCAFNISSTHFIIHQNSSMQIHCIWFALQKNKIIGAKIREIKMSINEILFYFAPNHYLEVGHAWIYIEICWILRFNNVRFKVQIGILHCPYLVTLVSCLNFLMKTCTQIDGHLRPQSLFVCPFLPRNWFELPSFVSWAF